MEQLVPYVALGGSVVAVLAWLFRLEGRVQGQEQRHEDHVHANHERHEQHERRHDEMRTDLSYIRDRIDRALSKQ